MAVAGMLKDIGADTGDIVRCVKSGGGDTTVGTLYKIEVCPDDGDHLAFVDNAGDWCEDTYGYEFEIVQKGSAK